MKQIKAGSTATSKRALSPDEEDAAQDAALACLEAAGQDGRANVAATPDELAQAAQRAESNAARKQRYQAQKLRADSARVESDCRPHGSAFLGARNVYQTDAQQSEALSAVVENTEREIMHALGSGQLWRPDIELPLYRKAAIAIEAALEVPGRERISIREDRKKVSVPNLDEPDGTLEHSVDRVVVHLVARREQIAQLRCTKCPEATLQLWHECVHTVGTREGAAAARQRVARHLVLALLSELDLSSEGARAFERSRSRTDSADIAAVQQWAATTLPGRHPAFRSPARRGVQRPRVRQVRKRR